MKAKNAAVLATERKVAAVSYLGHSTNALIILGMDLGDGCTCRDALPLQRYRSF